MANDKTKILREAVDIYVAPTGTAYADPGDAADWTLVGWCEGGSVKLTPKNRNTIVLHNDQDMRLSTDFLFEAMGLETTLAQIADLEAFEDADVDFLLILRSDRTKGRLLAGMTFIVEPEFVFSDKTPKKIKVEGTRTAQALSNFYSEVTSLPAEY
jgi:hypothetical protein